LNFDKNPRILKKYIEIDFFFYKVESMENIEKS